MYLCLMDSSAIKYLFKCLCNALTSVCVCACAHIHNFARVAFTHALILLNAPVHAFTCVFLCLFNHATICTDASLQDTCMATA